MSEMTICTVTTCGRPSDGWFVCKHHGEELVAMLDNVPWIMEQLDLAVTGQVRYGSPNGARSTEIPLPVNMRASDVQHYLVNEISTTVRMIAEDNSWDEPEGSVLNAARWLAHRVSAVRLHVAGGEMIDNLLDLAESATLVVDKPAQRQYLGNCEDEVKPESEGPVCTGAIYQQPGEAFAECDRCRSVYMADTIRERLLKSLDDRLCTAAEIARLSTFLGLKANREQVRNKVNVWAKRGRITRFGSLDDDDTDTVDEIAPTYKFGIVWRLLMQEDATREKVS